MPYAVATTGGGAMKSNAPMLLTLAAILVGCMTARPTRLVLLESSTGARYVGAAVPGADTSMTASIEINGVSYRGKFTPSDSGTAAILVGTGSDLLHCMLRFDAKTRIGSGQCVQSGAQRFNVTLSQG
jgi:hypothetical protein